MWAGWRSHPPAYAAVSPRAQSASRAQPARALLPHHLPRLPWTHWRPCQRWCHCSQRREKPPGLSLHPSAWPSAARGSVPSKGSAVPSQASSRGLKQARQKAASHADNTRCLCHKHGVDNENQETQTARTRQPGEDRPLPGTGGHACARVARSAGDVPGKAPGSSACCNARAALVCDAHSSRAVQSTTCACRQHCCCRHSITTLPARGPPERLAPAVKVALQC